MAITGRNIGPEICKALGIEGQRVRAIDIHIAAGQIVTVTVERLMNEDEGERLIPVLDRYELVEKPVAPVAT